MHLSKYVRARAGEKERKKLMLGVVGLFGLARRRLSIYLLLFLASRGMDGWITAHGLAHYYICSLASDVSATSSAELLPRSLALPSFLLVLIFFLS